MARILLGADSKAIPRQLLQLLRALKIKGGADVQ